MSPEQALGRRQAIDHRTDVYSLGATLYELLTLRPAFPGDDRQDLVRRIATEDPVPARRVNPAAPAELETIVQKAMAKEPAERYATAGELAADLRRWLDDRPIRARRPTPAQRAAKWVRRHRPLVASLAAAAGLLVAGTVVGLVAFALKERRLADEHAGLARDREVARQETAAALYRAKLDHAAALTLARVPGYRDGVWRDLREAIALGVPGQSADEMRERVLAVVGDPVGLPAADGKALPRPPVARLPGGGSSRSCGRPARAARRCGPYHRETTSSPSARRPTRSWSAAGRGTPAPKPGRRSGTSTSWPSRPTHNSCSRAAKRGSPCGRSSRWSCGRCCGAAWPLRSRSTRTATCSPRPGATSSCGR
jgi:hypothetical protein